LERDRLKQRALAEIEPVALTGAARLATIMTDPVLSDPRWFGMPIRPGPAPVLSDDQWAETLEQEARCRRAAADATPWTKEQHAVR
jgi:hypothetical protein